MKITADFFKQMIETVKKDRKKQIIAAGVVLLIIVLAIVSCGTKGEAKTASSEKAKAESGKNVKSGWQVYSKVDQFGDTTDETVLVLKNQKGTYSSVNEGSKDADLEWEMRVALDGTAEIILKEGKQDVSLSTLESQYDEYTITVKEDDGKTVDFEAEIVRNSDVYNALRVKIGFESYYDGDELTADYVGYVFSLLLARNKNPKMVISADNGMGSYSLGTIKTEGFSELVFGESVIEDANKLIDNKNYEEAWKSLFEYLKYKLGRYDSGSNKSRAKYIDTIKNFYSTFSDDVLQLCERGLYNEAGEMLNQNEKYFSGEDFNRLNENVDVSDFAKKTYYNLLKTIKLMRSSGFNEKCIKSHTFDGKDYICSICGFKLDRVGLIGPAGGYIFYDCDADNDTGNEDGLTSSECGWRFLEAASEDLPEKYVWGDDGKLGTQTGIGTGKVNTEKISATRDGKTTAAKACLDYSVDGFDDWFLPSIVEMLYMYDVIGRDKMGFGSLSNYGDYYSSSEYDDRDAYAVGAHDGHNWGTYRSNKCYVRPCRAF